MHAVATLVAISELAGRLEPAGNRLRALLPRDCPDEVRARIREQKRQLLALLRLEFLMVRSAVLNETIYFAANEQTRAGLVAAGAAPGCIYTRAELSKLVAQHRREPITVGELLRIHCAKRIFNGQITAGTGARDGRQV